jgi:DnaJ-class molecular chaperone
LKSAYRRLALKLHPDVNQAPDASERFSAVKTAYTVLSDDTQRAKYDRARRGSTSSAPGSASRFWESREAASTPSQPFYGLGDFFRDLEKDLSSRTRSRPAKAAPKSLLEELADVGLSVGEELLEFLEKRAPSPPPQAAPPREPPAARKPAPPPAPPPSVDDELLALKRKMGL